MRRLRVITPEEQRILDGGAVDKAAYTARADRRTSASRIRPQR